MPTYKQNPPNQILNHQTHSNNTKLTPNKLNSKETNQNTPKTANKPAPPSVTKHQITQ